MPALSEEVIAAIRAGVPAYSRPLRGRFGAGIRAGVEQALGQFADLLADPGLDRSGAERVYRGLGRGEHREQRSLDALLAAYRVGARVSWRRVAGLAIDARVDRRTLALLAEAVFAYIDEISALSVEGYTEAQAAAAGEAERRRRRLTRLLLDPRAEPAAVAQAAAEANWEPPATIAALAWRGEARRLRSTLPAGTPTLIEEDGGLALLADPEAPGVRARLSRASGESTPVLGPTVEPPAASLSARRARDVQALIEGGVLDEVGGLVLADDHLAVLASHGEPEVLAELARRCLEPLAGETPASRARLVATLRSWLDHQGEIRRVADDLQVHPQTVRYRLARLRERFGARLDDPDARFELALALRGQG